ncbi:MAG: hypothetical protein JSS30_02920 [Verrucomicrobia bacterium]|nr:hypothetical protein [Verrucomicrobiota bacterium]
MLSEIKQVASEKFCHYVGQATCSTLSNFVPSNLPSALTAIAGLGTAAVIIYRNWNATVLTKPLEKEVRVAPGNNEQNVVEVPEGIRAQEVVPDAPGNNEQNVVEVPEGIRVQEVVPVAPVVIAVQKEVHVVPGNDEQNVVEVQKVIPAQEVVREDFPELTAEKLEITKFYYVQGLVPIIGSNPRWVNCEAPYLNSDLRMADDSKIPLIEGDYIIRVELNNSNSRKDELIERYYFFPAALVRRLHPKMPIIIKYKGEQKILTISEALFQVLEKTLSRFEKEYYPPDGSLANDPVSVSAEDKSSLYKGKRYFAPPKFA